MAKFAYVVTKWIGTGTAEDPQRPDIPEGYTRCEDVTGQFVKLSEGSPDPNVVVVKVEESRDKHKGFLNSLKTDSRVCVLEEWEDDAEAVEVATDAKLQSYLVAEGVTDTVGGTRRTEALIRLAKGFDRR